MKRLLAIFLILVTLPVSAYAQTAEEYVSQRLSQKNFDHEYFLEYVLFGRTWTKKQDTTYYDDQEKLSNLAMIEFACTLCIDQFNNNDHKTHEGHQKMLDRLKKRVRGLPVSIDELNPDKNSETQLSGTNHRTYTHRGWKFNYDGSGKPGNIAHSEKREAILRKTVVKVFGFNVKEDNLLTTVWSSLSGAATDEARCDSYCRLFYYIHLLGDCYEDENFMQANGTNNGQKMPLGRLNASKEYVDDVETSDIITEFIWVCEQLFSESETNTENYPHLKNELARVNKNIKAIYKNGGIRSPEKYAEYHKCTCELMQVLMINLPNLLKNEADFQYAFKDFL